MTAAKNQKRHPLPRLGVFGQPELPATQAALGRVRWAALTVLLAVCLVCYNYTDLPLIVRHSISFWDALRTGRLNQFYQLATALPIGQATGQTGEVPYDIWVYVLLAVWNLPVYLWELATGLTFETNLIAMVWVRLAGMLPFVGANWAILGIARQLGRPKEQGLWACWGFSTSLFLLNGLFCIGQIDIFNVFFTLMGLWAWLKKDERGFIGWFALAVTFKMFALMVFLPLLLLEEKRLWRIAGASAGACSLSLLSKLLFLRDKMNTPTQFDERRFIRFLFGRNLDLGGATISAFVLLFGATVLVCWLIAGALSLLLKAGEKKGKPDLNILFQYNMPLRALAQMTNGALGEEFVDGLVLEAKGFWIIGILRALVGLVQNVVGNSRWQAKLDEQSK